VSVVSLDTRALQVPPRALYDGAALTFEVDPREEQMVAALREGDDRAFAWLVDQHHAMLVRLALRYVPDMATAEDVTQETWLHVLRGLGRFEFRSSLKTWDREHPEKPCPDPRYARSAQHAGQQCLASDGCRRARR
jgi:hypothetical protein